MSNFVALEVHYHYVWKREYLNKSCYCKRKVERQNTLQNSINTKSAATKEVFRYVRDNVLNDPKPEFLSNPLDIYNQMYVTEGGDVKNIESYINQNFSVKLQFYYGTNQYSSRFSKKNCSMKN